MKIVINRCFGGFGLSPKAILELWKRGGPVTLTPATKYFGTAKDLSEARKRWRLFLKTGKSSGWTSVFTPDEETVIYDPWDIDRTNSILISVVEEMGSMANGPCANLAVVEIPDGIDWEIKEYDGSEHVAEKHRVWY